VDIAERLEMKTKILIADDNKDNLYMLETLLKGHGYAVATAVNGGEALKKLRAGDFQMIIADILMPVMDGFQLCRECKTDPKLKNIAFVFYTATYTDAKDENLATKLGADMFIRKPMEPDKFISTVQDIIEHKTRGRKPKKASAADREKQVLKLYNQRLVEKLEHKMQELQQKNIALREVLTQIEAEKAEIQKQVIANVDTLLMPVLRKLRKNSSNLEKQHLDLLEQNVRNLTSEFGARVSGKAARLTPRQIEICNMIKGGMTSKEIAEILFVSLRTVETHRNEIRKKLGISQKKTNLTTYLQSLD
jgi:DNA-binding NarL/FixJ family response regulator